MQLFSIQGIGAASLSLIMFTSCGGPSDTPSAPTQAPMQESIADGLQRALILAEPGSTVTIPAGHYHFTTGLSLDVDGVTLRGEGQETTILDFSSQASAGEGLLVTSDDVTLEGFTIRNTTGDGIKSKNADRIIYRDLTVEWTGGPDAGNGAYGVYPVESSHVLIERVRVTGASDAGIYVGQSDQIIVRDSHTDFNVAGIEIENSTHADVYGNLAENNTGGILVFDLPNLPKMGGHSTRVFDNDILNNNTPNFAPEGNIVAEVPAGTGVLIMANDNIHVFGNRMGNNNTAHVIVSAYSNPFEDENYNPFPRNIAISGNTYTGGGTAPDGELAGIFLMRGGKALPAVVWDGVSRVGEAVTDINLSVNEDASAGFLSLGFGSYPIDLSAVTLSEALPAGRALPAPEPVVLPQDAS